MKHMFNMPDRIASMMLQRLFNESLVTVTRVTDSIHKHIFRMEFETAPGAVHSQKVVWYEFEDEVQQFSEGWFQTQEACEQAFRTYCKFFL